MSRMINITYDILKKNTLTVYAEIEEEADGTSESGRQETVTLTVYTPDMQTILERNSVTGDLPLAVSVEVYYEDIDEKGASCIAVANRTTDGADFVQDDETRKQQEINIERLQDIITLSCSYTLTSCAATGCPTLCAVSQTRLQIEPCTDYKLVGRPENASLLCASETRESYRYSGRIVYNRKEIRFPERFQIGNDSNIPLPLMFTCEATLQKISGPKFTRVAVLKFLSK